MHRSRMFSTATTIGAAALLAACGAGPTSGSPAARSSATMPMSTAPSPPTLGVATSGLGTVLVDGHGRTVYVFSADRPGAPACTAACLAAWPIVSVAGTPQDPPGASARLGVLLRADGVRQLTIDGLPAYTFTGDGAAGATTGEGKGLDAGVFTAVDASGAAIPAPVPAPPPVAASQPTRVQPRPPAPPPVAMPAPSPRRTGTDGDGDNRGGPDDRDGGV